MTKEQASKTNKKEDKYYYFDRFQDYGIFIEKRTLFFCSQDCSLFDESENGIDFQSSAQLCKNLLFLDIINNKPITLFWSSPGGYWDRGMAIYDMIKNIKSPIIMIGLGMVRSMGTIIMQACETRLLTKNCDFMIHDGEEGMEGPPKTVEAWADYSKFSREKMYDIYLEKIRKVHPKFTKKKVDQMCSHDCILTTKETVEIGLADGIYEG